MTKTEAITRLSMIFANCDTEMCKGAYACKYCDEAISMAIEALEQEPKCGEWLDYLEEGLKWECSECGSKFTTPWNYCPHCGADMRGDEQ